MISLQSHNFPPFLSVPSIAFSPCTSKHQPSYCLLGLSPSNPPTAAPGKSCLASSRISSSKVPGWSHTDRTPASLASLRSVLVTEGGVMTDREVEFASERAEGDGTVLKDLDETVMEEARGLSGVGVMDWVRYQAKTLKICIRAAVRVFDELRVTFWTVRLYFVTYSCCQISGGRSRHPPRHSVAR